MDRLRVAVWSTGWIGSIAVAGVVRRPDMELTGVWAHTPDKVGRDAGELAGIGAVGVTATSDARTLVDLRPDCVVCAASGPDRDAVGRGAMAATAMRVPNAVPRMVAAAPGRLSSLDLPLTLPRPTLD